jgi:hypothetical protein
VFHFHERDEVNLISPSQNLASAPSCPCLRSESSRMLPRLIDDPKHWLECAAEMRSAAFEIADSDGRAIALRVANDLEWFADWVALRKGTSSTNHPT